MEDYKVCAAMVRFGGSFAKNLGEAALAADPINLIKIKTAFPEIWEEYTNLAKLRQAAEPARKAGW